MASRNQICYKGMRFRKKKGPVFKIDWLGSVGIERVQMPHSLLSGGHRYQVVAYTFRFGFKDGPTFFERRYISGDPESITKMKSYIKQGELVDSEYDAKWRFWEELGEWFRVDKGW